jgi:peptide/nickel transport system permease protein
MPPRRAGGQPASSHLRSVYMGILIGGVVIIETVFAWPGLGSLVYEAVVLRDYPVIQGVTLVIGA